MSEFSQTSSFHWSLQSNKTIQTTGCDQSHSSIYHENRGWQVGCRGTEVVTTKETELLVVVVVIIIATASSIHSTFDINWYRIRLSTLDWIGLVNWFGSVQNENKSIVVGRSLPRRLPPDRNYNEINIKTPETNTATISTNPLWVATVRRIPIVY